MKNQKFKFFTMMLASAIGAAALSGAVFTAPVQADETAAEKYSVSVSEVFSTSGATSKTDGDWLAFDMKNKGSVTLYRRDLALKWYNLDENKTDYLNFELAFNDTNFTGVSVVLETAVAAASKEDKATNTLKFKTVTESETTKVYASVNDNENTVEITDLTSVKVALGEGANYGEFDVFVGGEKAGTFTNIGANYGDYVASSSSSSVAMTPFSIKAEVRDKTAEETEDPKTNVSLKSLNYQTFKLESEKIVDDARPVLVVNNEITGYTLGTAWAMDYVAIDVIDRSVTTSVKYMQYDPDLTTAEKIEESYKDLTTSTYFYDTNYMDGDVEKSVFQTYGKEYLSVRFDLSDEYYKGDTKTSYYLADYANEPAVPDGAAASWAGIKFVPMDQNKDGAYYSFLKNTKKTVGEKEITVTEKATDYDEIVYDNDENTAYQELVTEAAKDLKAGKDFYLPTLKNLINDNGGYKNLSFTISYRSSNQTSSTPSTRSATSSTLQFPVSKSGEYQFKVFAKDKANNTMYYYDEKGEKQEISSDNIWEIDLIPYFSFTVAETSLSVEDPDTDKTRLDTVAIDDKYDDFDIELLGDDASGASKSAKLYTVDLDGYNQKHNANLSKDQLYEISYQDIVDKAKDRLSEVTDGNYDKLYLEVYAAELGVSAENIGDLFKAVTEYDASYEKDDMPDDYAYGWNSSDISFTAVKEGELFLVMNVYTDAMVPSLKACAYKVVEVETEPDVIPGETQWLENNIVSVILFGIAGLMLILIIILLLVKPSDETLEDVEQQAKGNKTQKANK